VFACSVTVLAVALMLPGRKSDKKLPAPPVECARRTLTQGGGNT
jgi:hypothetical protein